jgi:copper homeostasis protein
VSEFLARAVLVEACCDSVYTACAAQEAGAGRVELCGPGEGGSTPSFGLIARTRDRLRIPLHVMIRPHVRDFLYGEDDAEVMANDIATARALGAEGIVLGPLLADGQVDMPLLTTLAERARPMKVVFHRAFDRTPDAMAALDLLLLAGVDMVLTSGHARTALEGADILRALQERAGDRLTILAGGSVRAATAGALVQRSGVREVHARGTDPSIISGVVEALRHP